jgi:hypothetical protein
MPETIPNPPPGFDHLSVEEQLITSILSGIGLLRALNVFLCPNGISISFANA